MPCRNPYIPSLRLYHFAVKKIWKAVAAGTLFAGVVALLFYVSNGYALWHAYRWYELLLGVVFFFWVFMDVRLALIFLTRKDKSKVRRYVLRPGERKDYTDIE